MRTIVTKISRPTVIKSSVTKTGAVGPPGPNFVTEETATNLTGMLIARDGGVHVATVDEVREASALQSALPAPLALDEGKIWHIPANQQMLIALPITDNGGTLLVDGTIVQV